MNVPMDMPPDGTEPRPRRSWVTGVLLLAALAAAAAILVGEPLIVLVAGLLLLAALWGWLS